jgi:glycosyltransferase involved in cell wall biosynthesis
MLTGHNIVYFGNKWDDMLRNPQQLMSIFARQNKVLFVDRQRDNIRTTLDRFRRGKLGLSDLRRSSVRQISENLFVFRYPVWAPVTNRFPLSQLTRIVRRLSLRKAVQRLQMSRPIVWFYFPDMIDLVNEIPSARLLLYQVLDEYTAYYNLKPAYRRRIEESEKKAMAQVDAVIVVSKKLYEAKRPFNPNTYLVPNGVNYQAYADALADPRLPNDLQMIKPPRLGFSGVIGDRLNWDMLKDLAQENPEWSLVLLGTVPTKRPETWQTLLALPNVHHLGPVEWSQVPHYIKGFDVGLIPYLQDQNSEAISPLKLYDYLAAGLPVASVDIPAAREFDSYIQLADTPENFPQAVRAALADTAPERRQARRKIAAQHTWEARAERLSDLIQSWLTAKAQDSEVEAF